MANKTKTTAGVEPKTKLLFELLQKVKDGSVQLKEEEAVQVNSGNRSSDIIAEEQRDNQNGLAENLREINGRRSDDESNNSSRPIEGRFWSDTKVET
mgnify:CR=1 FL=1